MATTTKRSRSKTPTTKSARFREMLKTGKSIAEIVAETGEGYAFVYGVAKRAGMNLTAAKRRPTRAVRSEGSVVKIAVPGGFVNVNRETGKVTRSKS